MIRTAPSARDGRGIFATRNIASGERIEEAPVIVVPPEQIPHLAATVLDNYCFRWGAELEEVAIHLGLCSLCNHSYEPNAQFVLRLDRLAIEFIALRDIAAGEEIMINYNGDPAGRQPVWFPAKP